MDITTKGESMKNQAARNVKKQKEDLVKKLQID